MRRIVMLCLVVLAGVGVLWAQEKYEKPAGEILKVLNAQPAPATILSPTSDWLILAQRPAYPSISDLAEPMLRLAGVRINPNTNSERSYIMYFVGLTLKKLSDGSEQTIALPSAVRIGRPIWNLTGTMFAFTNESANAVELWVADIATGKARRIGDLRLNPALDSPLAWMPDQRTLLVKLIRVDRGVAPTAPAVPPGPKVQESVGAKVASSTYEVRDVLKSPHDADLFDYYTTSQLAFVDAASGQVTKIGPPAVYTGVSPSPDGQYLLVEHLRRPYSFQRAYYRFPSDVEVWTTKGELVETLARRPLAEQVPINGVITGPRNQRWRATAPATIDWVEALDDGNPSNKVPFRDRILTKTVSSIAKEMWKCEQRFANLSWIEGGDLALMSDFDRDRRWVRTYLLDATKPEVAPRLVVDMSVDEKYKDPGNPVYKPLPGNGSCIVRQGDWIYLSGDGASPEGDRPFLDRLNVRTLKSERLFRSEPTAYELFVDWVDPAGGTFITRHETPAEPPNFYLRTLDKKALKNVVAGEAAFTSTTQPITRFPDPTPQIRGITKRLVTYARPDGVSLSFTLYLPPGYKEGTRLPTMFWAYPLDYAQGSVAGQVEGSTQRFTTIRGSSQLFFLLAGYAVLDNVAMPVVGPPETVYDTFVEQIVANAKAAIDKAVELGVTDSERIGVAGHSHGALMTANLLAYSDLFRAGIARSGAFNHTLRPFGFQNERRTLYQARDVYIKISPVLQADKINEPLLIIHGEIDQNPGTVPMQSEKLYEALRGAGGTVRLVMLPYESHGYSARESNEHVVYEMISWFDRYVKDAKPRGVAPAAS
jgi:dipeptidyl aminopeptidase/acylaminoacyl peptidase